MARVYTRRGDQGSTELGSLGKVSKSDPRIELLGTVDELQAVVGLCRSFCSKRQRQEQLRLIQQALGTIAAGIVTPPSGQENGQAPLDLQVKQLEEWIDRADRALPPLKSFVLPEGSPETTHLHFARTVCRRLERHLVRTFPGQKLAELTFLNRLSDFLFIAARTSFQSDQNNERGDNLEHHEDLQIQELSSTDLSDAIETIRSLPEFFYERDFRKAEANYTRFVQGQLPEGFFLTAKDGNRVVGVVGAINRTDTDGVWFLASFAVRRGERGQGIGRMLLSALEERLLAKKARLVFAETTTSAYCDSTRSFYESMGYDLAGTVADFWQDGDPLALYQKRLR